MTLYETLKAVADDHDALCRSRILPAVFPLDRGARDALAERRDALYYGALMNACMEFPLIVPAYQGLTTCEGLASGMWERIPYVIPKRSLLEWLVKGERRTRTIAPDDARLIREFGGRLEDFLARPRYELEHHCLPPLLVHARFIDGTMALARAYQLRQQEGQDEEGG
jgi:hypothetical protein